jgi:hypothetical protein
LEGGPPRFSPRFTGADLLRNAIGRPVGFVYGTIALCGARFHALQLPIGLVTPAGTATSRAGALQPLVRNAWPLTRTWFGLFPFRSPLLGESRLISFPPGTEMFQFPGLPPHAYEFSMRYRRITSGGFPHSGIRGSRAIQRLPAAYRSRSRPSSTPGAKASTMCPSYLDGDRAHAEGPPEGGPPEQTRGDTRLLAMLCSFQGPREAHAWSRRPVSQNSTACGARRWRAPPGPVDVSVAARAGAGAECAGRRATAPILELP